MPVSQRSAPPPERVFFLGSIVTKNIALFLLILAIAVVPLALRYDQDSREYEIQSLASKLEFFAQRGATWIDVGAVTKLLRPEDKRTPAYRSVLASLQRIEREFGVDNAIVMRREDDGSYTYLAAGHDGFEVRQPADIHTLFPATYKATNDTWLAGEMMHSQLFGGRVGDTVYDKFLQINIPIKKDGRVVAILMLNKFANPVAQAVRMKTMRVVALSLGLVAAGLVLFALISARMLRPLRALTTAAGRVARGDLGVALPGPRSRDEVGRLSTTFAGMLDGLRQRDFIRDTFGRYVTKEVVDELLGSPDGLRLGGEARVVTILVSDLRGFTSLAARLAPGEVLEILNRYLERMVAALRRRRGTIDEIQGDGILAFFGAPLAAPDDPFRAVACALELQLELERFNAEQRGRGLPELGMGVGINTGEVIVGNIGSEQRTKYGAVGSAINMAYRIESHTIGGQILLSPTTYEHVRALARVRGTLTADFKGLDRPLTLYDVSGLDGEYRLSLPEKAAEVFVPVAPPLGAACFTIEGKAVSTTAIPGTIVRLAAAGADLVLGAAVPPHTNLRLVLDPVRTGGAYEAYAKVLPPDGASGDGPPGAVRIAFTAMTDQARTALDACRSAAGAARAPAG